MKVSKLNDLVLKKKKEEQYSFFQKKRLELLNAKCKMDSSKRKIDCCYPTMSAD